MPGGQGRCHFRIPLSLKHDKSTPIQDLLNELDLPVGRDLRQPLKILEKHWVDNVGDLRLLFQEDQMRTLGLPIRLCVWIEEELKKANSVPVSGSIGKKMHD